MKKRIIKKMTAAFMVTVMLLSMAGCGEKGSGKEKKKENANENTKEMVFEEAELPLEGVEGEISSYFVKNDKLYISTNEWKEEGADKNNTVNEEIVNEGSINEENINEESVNEENVNEGSENEENVKEESVNEEIINEESVNEESVQEESVNEETVNEEIINEENEAAGSISINRVYVANLDGSDVKEISLPKFDKSEAITNMLVDDDGNIIFLIQGWDMSTEEGNFHILKTDAEGEELFKKDIAKTLNLSQENYINKILLDDKGRLVIIKGTIGETTDVGQESVCVLDENGKLLCKIKSDLMMIGAPVKAKDGSIVCSFYVEGEEGTKIQILDIDHKKWGESKGLITGQLIDAVEGMKFDLYYMEDLEIYGYDMVEKKSTKVIDYKKSNLSFENTFNMTMISEDQLLGSIWNEGEKPSIVLYKKVDSSTVANKTTIIFGGFWMDDSIKKAAIEFNKQSKEYNVEFKDYSEEEDPIAKMNADIIAGKAPDIISLHNLPTEQYVGKGLLEDLTPYYEKDPDIKIGDLIPSVAEAMQIDGKYYYVVPSFSLSTLIGSSKDVGTKSGWTLEEMKTLLQEKGEGVRPFYTENKSAMLYSILGGVGLSDFMDWKTGTCSFDSQEFKDILEICNTIGKDAEDEQYESAMTHPSLIKEGKVLFAEGMISMESIEIYKKIFNGDITCIGYPQKDKQGTYFNFGMQAGIYAKSKQKEGAWEFLRSLMSKEYQGKNGNMGDLYNNPNPTRQDCFDMQVKAKTATKPYTDEIGQEITPLGYIMEQGGLEIEIKPLTQEEANLYIDLVNSTKQSGGNSNTMIELVQEEAKVYFTGEKSLEETVEIIQNRMTTYINENR